MHIRDDDDAWADAQERGFIDATHAAEYDFWIESQELHEERHGLPPDLTNGAPRAEVREGEDRQAAYDERNTPDPGYEGWLWYLSRRAA